MSEADVRPVAPPMREHAPVPGSAQVRAAAPTPRMVVLGTGHALPTARVSSAELDLRLGLRRGTVEQAGGVRQRHVAGPGETAAALAAQAARRALAAAGLDWGDIDALVAASGTPDQAMPSNAALVHRELGLSGLNMPAFDIGASCLGFVAALDTLCWAVAAGRYRRVLVVASDIASCGLDWSTLEASALFGDGAAAAVLGTDPARPAAGLLAAELRTLSEGAGLCRIEAGGSRFHPSRGVADFESRTRFRMDGRAVFRLATQHLPGFVDGLLRRAGVTRRELDWVVPHQASALALAHLTRRLGFARDRVVDILADHGNQIAASLPTALDIAVRDGRIRRGQTVLLLGTGAGLSFGGAVLRW